MNIAQGSRFAERLRETKAIYAYDLDGTLDSGFGSATELEARRTVRQYSRTHGAEAFITARSAGFVLSDTGIESAHGHGFSRPRPRRTVNPVDTRELLDPHVVVPFGHESVWEYPDSSYRPDPGYEKLLGSGWRSGMLKLIDLIDVTGEIHDAFAEIENEENYRKGIANVIPLSHRIQLNFGGPDWFPKMRRVISLIRTGLRRFPNVGRNLRFVDESNPSRDRGCAYLVPRHATKEACFARLIRQGAIAADIEESDVRVFYAGDTLTDLWAGLLCADTFVLAGGSRLTPYIAGPLRGQPFGTVSLSAILKEWRFRETGKAGVYSFKPPRRAERTFIVADLAFPGLVGAESVLESLELSERLRVRA